MTWHDMTYLKHLMKYKEGDEGRISSRSGDFRIGVEPSYLIEVSCE
jgi:hypothetical protein